MKLAPVRIHKISMTLQYAATIIVLMVMGMALLSAMMFYNQSKQNDSYIQDFGGIIAHQLAKSSANDLLANDIEGLRIQLGHIRIDNHIISAIIFNGQRQQIASIGQVPDAQIDLDKTFYKLGSSWRFEPFISIRSIPIHYNNEIIGYATVVFSQKLLDAQFKNQLYMMFATFIFILFLVLLASIYLGRKMTQPLRSLISATEDIRSGKIDIITDRRHDELGALIDAINNMSQGLIRKSQVESMLDKILTKNVKDKIMDQLDTVHMAGEHVFATVLFADIVGFTSISEKISPEEVQKLLNEYYSYFNACSRFYFGTVDKYIGDCVMVVFGAPKEDAEHQYHAITCAILMQKLAQQLNIRREREGLFPIELRIGINSGKMMAGLIGSDDRMEYTVVGDAVNLASRLCNEAEGAQTIIEESLYDTVNPDHQLTVESYKMIRVRGKEEPVKIYSVTDIAQKYRKGMDDLIEDILSKHNK
jgi:adenylate cyclase